VTAVLIIMAALAGWYVGQWLDLTCRPSGDVHPKEQRKQRALRRERRAAARRAA